MDLNLAGGEAGISSGSAGIGLNSSVSALLGAI